MTKEEIKKIVDDERAEQLTARLCRHWEVATRRLTELVQDLEDGIDTCVEAEVYAAIMRMHHLVGEMKKRAVFGAHSDNDLAEKLTEKRYVGTFRKNIQEGMGEEPDNLKNIFNTICQKYNALAHPKK